MKRSRFYRRSFICLSLLFALVFPVTFADQAGVRETSRLAASQGDSQEVRKMVAEGTGHYEKANFDEALVWYSNALQLNPANGHLQELVENTRANLEYQKRLVENLPESGPYRRDAIKEKYGQAESFFQNEQYEKAQREFYEVWLLTGGYEQTRGYLGRVQDALRQTSAPEPDREIVVAQNEETVAQVRELLALANDYLDEGRYEKALEAVDTALRADPESRRARTLRKQIVETQDRALRNEEQSRIRQEMQAQERAATQRSEEEEQRVEEQAAQQEIERLRQEAQRRAELELSRQAREAEAAQIAAEEEAARIAAEEEAARIAAEEEAARIAAEEEAAQIAAEEEAARIAAEEEAARIAAEEEAARIAAEEEAARIAAEEEAAQTRELAEVSEQEYESMDSVAEPAVENVDPGEKTPAPVAMEQPDPAPAAAQELDRDARRVVRELLSEADKAFRDDELGVARDKWQQVLDIDEENMKARTMLEETAEAYEELLAQREKEQAAIDAEKAAQRKLDGPISFATSQPVPLRSLRRDLVNLTDLNISIAQGGEYLVNASFTDTPFREVLDTLLTPIGLVWTRDGNVITIKAELETKVFNLTTEEMSKVSTLMEQGYLQRVLWGEGGEPPLSETLLERDERQNVLLIRDSKMNVEKLASFLESLREETPTEVVTRIYTIREEKAKEIKALVEAVLQSQQTSSKAIERKVFLQDTSLIVRGTLDDMRKVEELLNNEEISGGIYDDKLEVATFVIVPKEELQQQADVAAEFAKQVKEVIETLLYAKEGIKAAREEGRRMWYEDVDPAIKQVTITDYPDRIRAVSDFLHSLPQLEQEKREEIIFLKYLDASDNTDLNQIREMLGIVPSASATDSGGGGDDYRRFNLRVDTEAEFRGARILLRRVDGGDITDDRDDTVDIVVNTPSASQELTGMQENGAGEYVDEYRISAGDIDPSGTEGEGSAEIIVYYDPVDDQEEEEDEPVVVVEQQDEEDLEIIQFGTQNAIVLRYTDPSDVIRVRNLLDKLDVPQKQVDIETLFVTVDESRAKEFSSDFTFFDRDDPRNYGQAFLGLDDNNAPILGNDIADGVADDVFNGAFGTGSFFSVDAIFDDVLGNYIDMQLRFLETEGVASISNGPHIAVMHNESASFRIEQRFLTTDDDNNDTAEGGVQLNWIWEERVTLDVTPLITSTDSIILDTLDVEIYEPSQAKRGQGGWMNPFPDPNGADPGSTGNWEADERKTIETRARVSNGGTIVIGGWTGEEVVDRTSGVPGLRNLPWLGKIFFSKNQHTRVKTNLLIFLSAQIVE